MEDLGLGDVCRIYRPSTLRIWGLGLLGAAPLAMLGLAILISLDSADPWSEIWNMSPCLGGLGLLLIALSAVMVSEIRKWKKARSVRLTLCTHGFVFESQGDKASCLWSEVQDVRYKQVLSMSKASPGSKVRVIGSIVRNDGTAFVLPDALPLTSITAAVSQLRRKGS